MTIDYSETKKKGKRKDNKNKNYRVRTRKKGRFNHEGETMEYNYSILLIEERLYNTYMFDVQFINK